MSIITDEMDRLKKSAMNKFEGITCGCQQSSKVYFELGYAYGMDDARKIQVKIETLSREAVGNL